MMNKFASCTTLFVLFHLQSSIAGPHDPSWCYIDPTCNAKTWAGLCHDGKIQSPIDFNPENVRENRTLMKLRFNRPYLNAQTQWYIKNNGHTVQVQLNKDLSSNLLMDGDGLKGSYVFSQLHFHWGSTDDKGSEHTVSGKSYPMELHLVHFNSMYKSLSEAIAAKNNRALLVLGIFFKLSTTDNFALKPIVDVLSQIQNPSDDLIPESNALNISAFLPGNLDLFRYYGSLTTPGCFEVVHWNVFKNPVLVSQSQMAAFRKLKDSHGTPLVDNYRPTNPLAGRKVTEYEMVEMGYKPGPDEQDARKPTPDTDYDDSLPGGKKRNGAVVSGACSTLITTLSLGVIALRLKQ